MRKQHGELEQGMHVGLMGQHGGLEEHVGLGHDEQGNGELENGELGHDGPLEQQRDGKQDGGLPNDLRSIQPVQK